MDISDSTSASNSEFNEAMGNILSNSNENEAQNFENDSETNTGESILTSDNIEVNTQSTDLPSTSNSNKNVELYSETLIDQDISLMIEKSSSSKNIDDDSTTKKDILSDSPSTSNIEEHEELWLGDNTRQLVKVDTDEDFEVIVKSLETAIVETERYDIEMTSEEPVISSITTNSENSLEMPGIDSSNQNLLDNSPSNLLSDAVPDTPIMSMSLSPRLSSPTAELESPVIHHRNLQIYDEFATISEPKVESFDEQTSSLFEAMEPEIDLPPENEPSLLELQEATMPTDIPEEFQQSIETPMCSFRNDEISSDPDTLNDICENIEVSRQSIYEQINSITSNKNEESLDDKITVTEQGETSKTNEAALKEEMLPEIDSVAEEKCITSDPVTEESVSVIEEENEIESSDINKNIEDVEMENNGSSINDNEVTSTHVEDKSNVIKDVEVVTETENDIVSASEIIEEIDSTENISNEIEEQERKELKIDNDVSSLAGKEDTQNIESLETIENKQQEIIDDDAISKISEQECDTNVANVSLENIEINTEVVEIISEESTSTHENISEITVKETIEISDLNVSSAGNIEHTLDSKSEIAENIESDVSNTETKSDPLSIKMKEEISTSKDIDDEVSSSSVSIKHSLDPDENEQSPPKKIKLVREKFQKPQTEQPTQSTVCETSQEKSAKEIISDVNNESDSTVNETTITETKDKIEPVIEKSEIVEVIKSPKTKKLKLQRNYTLPEKPVIPKVIENIENIPSEEIKSDKTEKLIEIEKTPETTKEKITEEIADEIKVTNIETDEIVPKTEVISQSNVSKIEDSVLKYNVPKDSSDLIESVDKISNEQTTEPLITDQTDKSSAICTEIVSEPINNKEEKTVDKITEITSEPIDSKAEKAVDEIKSVSEISLLEDNKDTEPVINAIENSMDDNLINSELQESTCSKEININTDDVKSDINNVDLDSVKDLPDKFNEESITVTNITDEIISTENKETDDIKSDINDVNLNSVKENVSDILNEESSEVKNITDDTISTVNEETVNLQEENVPSPQICVSLNIDEISSTKLESDQDTVPINISENVEEITSSQIETESCEYITKINESDNSNSIDIYTSNVNNKENIEISQEIIEEYKDNEITSNEEVSSSNLEQISEMEPIHFKIECVVGNVEMEDSSNSLEHLPDIEPDTFKIDNIVANMEIEENTNMDISPDILEQSIKIDSVANIEVTENTETGTSNDNVLKNDNMQPETFIDTLTTVDKLEIESYSEMKKEEIIDIKITDSTGYIKETIQSETCVDTTAVINEIETEPLTKDISKTEVVETKGNKEKIDENYLNIEINKEQENRIETVVENIPTKTISEKIEINMSENIITNESENEKTFAIETVTEEIKMQNVPETKIIEVEINKTLGTENTQNVNKNKFEQKAENLLSIDCQFPLLASRLQEKLQPKPKKSEDTHIVFPTITQEIVNFKLREQFENKPSTSYSVTSDLPEVSLLQEISSITADHSATMESATKIKITKRKLDTPEPLMTRSITKPLSVQVDDLESSGTITERSHSSGALGHREYENIPKLVIKPIHKEGRSSPKITIKPIKPPEENMSKSRSAEELSHSPKITIKPIVKPDPLKITITKQKSDDTHSILKIYQPEDQLQSYEQSIQKYMKSVPKNDEMQHSPRITIKPVKSSPTASMSPKITVKSIPSPNEHVEFVHSPKITVKPIVNPEESYPKVTIKPVLRPEESQKVSQLSPRQIKLKSMTFESTSGVTVEPICGTSNLLPTSKSETEMQTSPLKISVKPFAKMEDSPKLTIKPITKTCEIVQSEDGTCNPLKLTIKPILKPEESSYQSPKITIKPIVKPDEGNQQLADELEKPERIILKIQKNNLPSPKERIKEPKKEPEIKIEAIPHDSEKSQKLDKIKLKLTKEGSHAQIIPSISTMSTESFSLKRSLGLSESGILDKRSKTEFGNTEILHTSDISINIVEPNAKPSPKTITEEVTIMKIDKTSGSNRPILNEQQISQSKFKEMLMKIQQKPDISCTPQIDADPDYSSSSDDVKIVEVIENDPLKDPLSLQDESNSQDIMIVNDVINTNPFPNVQIINAHSIEASLNTPKKRGRPRKNPLEVKPEIKGEDCIEVRPKRTCRAPPGRTPFAVKERKPRGAGRGRGGSRGRGASKSPQKSPKETKTTPRGKALKEAKALAKIEAARLSHEVVIDEITIEDSTNDTPAATPLPPIDSPKKLDVKESETSSQMIEPDVKVTQISEVLLKQPPPPAVYEEETRMSADNSSRAQTPARQVFTVPLAEGPEESQSSVQSTATTESSKTKKGRLEVCDPDSAVTTVEQIVEYSWGNGGPYMLQEQVAQFLGVKSFKRKYPGLTRRPVEMQERDYIREKGLVSESMCDMGLTAVPSSEILDIMYSDFQEKYEEYRKCLRDKQAKEISNKQKAVSLATSQEKNKIDFKERAIRSAANWNVNFNKARKESRKSCMDLQTFTINYPAGKIKVPHKTPAGHYPIALVPGQFTDYFKSYTSSELHYLPLNTVRYGPVLPNQPCDPSQSDGSQSDTDSSSGSDSDSSDDSMSTEEETSTSICKTDVHLTQLISTPKSKVH